MYTVFPEIYAHGTSQSKFHAGMYSKYLVSLYGDSTQCDEF